VVEELSTYSMVMIKEEDFKGKPAYRVEWGGEVLGYIPELSTLTKYWHEANEEGKYSRRDEVGEWGKAVKSMRADLKKDFMNKGKVWMSPLAQVVKEGGKIKSIVLEWGGDDNGQTI
jgi:hypothetical protein